MYVLLGNVAPIEMRRRDTSHLETREDLLDEAGRLTSRIDLEEYEDDALRELIAEQREPFSLGAGESITEISIPDGTPLLDAVTMVRLSWQAHSTKPPAWIECGDDTSFAALLCEAMRDDDTIPERSMPAGWMSDEEVNPSPSPASGTGITTATTTMAMIVVALVMFLATRLQLRTNAGRDFQARVMGNSGVAGAGTGTMRPADYLAITENSTAPALTDTTLTGELTGGGLARALATFSHTASATSYTLVFEWTSSDGTARTIQKMGVFNASSGGSLVFSSLVPSPPTLVAGDKLQITSTIDMS